MKKFLRSLLAKYMLIIILAISLLQIGYLILGVFLMSIDNNIEGSSNEALNESAIEEQWHAEAKRIDNISEETLNQHFSEWKQRFPDASMFWINDDGMLLTQVGVKESLPSTWDAVYTTKFIKERYGGDPFTVISFIGQDESNGFIVFEVPRSTLKAPLSRTYEQYGTIFVLGLIAMIFIFIVFSFLFFRSIRKRLLQLQDAMEIRDVDGLPIEIDVKKKDEIGQLETSFNQMVSELKESKEREQEEEQLRRELIANLSHDLRTPLTKVRAQTYSIAKEALSPEGEKAIKALEASVVNIDRLIENLMSYTLLMASKYQFEKKKVDVIRFVRESIASWYPVYEKEGYEVEVNLNHIEHQCWEIDPIWLGRILDNIFQNVLRHAGSGKYVGVKTESTDQYDALVISDRGKGMKSISKEKGAGIGLSIVDLMVKGMNLDWDIESNHNGTLIKIKKMK